MREKTAQQEVVDPWVTEPWVVTFDPYEEPLKFYERINLKHKRRILK